MGNRPYTYQKKAFTVLIVFACLVLIGISVLSRLDVQLTPSNSLPKLSIQFYWPSASARIIEKEVTAPLEGVLAAMKGLKSIRSVTKRGHGRINLEFKEQVSIDAMRFEVASLVRQVYPDLPEDLNYPSISLSSSGQQPKPLLTYALSASVSSYFIKKYADDHISSSLSNIDGVGGVQVYGATPFYYRLTYNADELTRLGISIEDISKALRTYFDIRYLGRTTSDEGLEFSVAMSQRQGGTFELSQIPVKSINGRLIYLNQLADLKYEEKRADAFYRVNGLNMLNIVVYPEDGVNNLKVADQVRAHMSTMVKELPEGYGLSLVYDETEYIKEELRTIIQRSLFSVLVLFIFVLLVSRQLKYLLLIFLSIVSNLAVAVALYYFLRLEIHLYSMAGITISLGLIIDTSIVMIDHLRNKGDKRVLVAILAATFTTLGALSAVFHMKESQQINLIDFAVVIAINLTVSISIALFFIPALMENIPLSRKISRRLIKRKKKVILFNKLYGRYILFLRRFRWGLILVLIFAFGLPIHWLPDHQKEQTWWSNVYNETLGSEWYQSEAAPLLETLLGGSLRLFTEYVFESSFYAEPERTTLHVRGSMPRGCTIQQLNQAVIRMEDFISQFDEVDVFNTSITDPQNAHIAIYFKEDHDRSGFPYVLKSRLESKAISLGGLDWSVYGVGRGFSNALGTGFRNSRIQLEGYDYEHLHEIATTLKKSLLTNPRIKEVDITEPRSWGAGIDSEYYMEFDEERLALRELSKTHIYGFLKARVSEVTFGQVYLDGALQEVVIQPENFKYFDVWSLRNTPVLEREKLFKLKEIASLEKRNSGNNIHKRNQQYQLQVAYDFIGPDLLGKKVRDQYVEDLRLKLPLGFRVFIPTWGGWNKDDESQYYLILYILVVIFVVCSVLFESLRQPFSILLMIPVSFIGVFLTFYLFDINFDQGGLAAFVMVAGLSVNSGVYIINDFNLLKKGMPCPEPRAYIKAFNLKCIPVFLTVLSTILGLVPFIWQGQNEVFWYAFATGTIGGLVFSLIAVVFYLPLLINKVDFSQKN
ncbi:efflux RND transporter permease subunit [Marinoscillum furvescens]|uniref:Multidrug efflux pump subunit AcrB n=1 Tax=Marinoscillum furvescens DSM 4134 TaxID=1122208 RepID=A0A3D9L0S2_MARFU|nr:efflux RND transporter permease subunit [Marinoscillum furvescens]RED94939.1 multidrug efflux pump subunit AcrB [Marinoscillum furvescens DSM 4134]